MTRAEFDALMADASPSVKSSARTALKESYEDQDRKDKLTKTIRGVITESNMRKPAELDIEAVHQSYISTSSVHRTGEVFGVTGETVRKALIKAGKKINRSAWSIAEEVALRDLYAKSQSGEEVCIKTIADKIGRSANSVACKAEELGITVKRGKHQITSASRKNMSIAQRDAAKRPGAIEGRARRSKEWHSKNEHPRGFLGGHHTEAAKKAISDKNTGQKREPDVAMRMLKTKVGKYGSAAPANSGRGKWKSAWREIGGVKIYARSKWEANYARYLEFLKSVGDILLWEHEPETFWFEKIKRGVRSYLPDFRVTLKDGTIEYHEVKGWMDAKSATKLKRMKIYHPKVKMVLRDGVWFKANTKQLSSLIQGWE